MRNKVLKDHWIDEEIIEEIRKYTESNDKEDTIFQNVWDTAKVKIIRKYIAIQTHITKYERNSYPKQLSLPPCRTKKRT